MLWLCLRFPLLPLEVFQLHPLESEDGTEPVIVADRQRVLLCNAPARSKGVKPGVSLATARALSPKSRCFERDLQLEKQALESLAYSCYHLTPAVALCTADSQPEKSEKKTPLLATDSLRLEISGCLRLFKGLSGLLNTLKQTLVDHGYSYRTSLAPTPGTAFLLNYSNTDTIPLFDKISGKLNHSQDFARLLAALPLSALPYNRQLQKKFKATGFCCLGDLLRLPHAAIGKRYGKDFLTHLQQLSGKTPDPQSAITLPPRFNQSLSFDNTITAADMLVFPMQRLLRALCGYLHGRRLHCSRINWHLSLLDGGTESIVLQLSQPQNQFAHFLALSRLQLEGQKLKSPVASLRLHVNHLYPAAEQSSDLFNHHSGGREEDMAAVLDKLRARLGPEAVYRLAPMDNHIPEQAWRKADVDVSNSDSTGSHEHQPPRPLWLLQPPPPLRIVNHMPYWHGELEILNGPERIESCWWQQAICRDYFVARHRDGSNTLCWIYRDRLTNGWFLHGTFA